MTTVEQLAEQTQTQPSGLTIGFNEEEKLRGPRIAKGVPSFDDVLQGKIKNIGTTNFQKFRLNNQEYTLQELLKLPNGQNILKNKYDSIINQPPELQDPNAPDILFKDLKIQVRSQTPKRNNRNSLIIRTSAKPKEIYIYVEDHAPKFIIKGFVNSSAILGTKEYLTDFNLKRPKCHSIPIEQLTPIFLLKDGGWN